MAEPDDDAAIALFQHALSTAQQQGASSYHTARLQLCFGELLRRCRRHTAATEHLVAARQIFQQLGCTS